VSTRFATPWFRQHWGENIDNNNVMFIALQGPARSHAASFAPKRPVAVSLCMDWPPGQVH
jgi:hypothetical protein